MTRLPESGLYAITPDREQEPAALASAVMLAIRGGAKLVQLRIKNGPPRYRQGCAESVLSVCRSAAVPMIVNDDVSLCAAVGADGVHVGRDDTSVAAAREQLGSDPIIGASCYDRIELAHRAVDAGASYVAFGSFFRSTTKPDAVPADLELITEFQKARRAPIAAIGGITPSNGDALVRRGASFLAAIEGVFGAPDIEAAARRYARLFANKS